MNSKIKEIKKLISEELKKEQFDFSKLRDLNDQLLAFDKSRVRFSVDAKHIHRLGYELVGKQQTALAELIKNAYDADATRVDIVFSNYDEPGGTLVISDNGHGMTEEVIRNSWMRLSTNDKEVNPISPIFGRSKAGRKGIGRFAVERLGKSLTLESMVQGETEGIRVSFNWDEDFTAGRDLAEIAYTIERFSKEAGESGLRLVIEGLRDKWTEKGFEEVWKSVLLLQSPFKVTGRPRAIEADEKSYAPDQGFSVAINGKVGEEVRKEISIEKTFLENGLATIEGVIDDAGKAHFFVKSKKYNLDEDHVADEKYLLVGSMTFEASYFIYKSSEMTGFSVRQAQKLGDKYGGIRVYRDGFRVLPYGEPNDDWLRLAYDAGRRFIIVPANNYNFFGQVELTSKNNPLFEETSSREGLIENDAYAELQAFVRNCLEWAVLRIAEARERKQKSSQRDFVSQVRKPSEVLDEVIKSAGSATSDGIEAPSLAEKVVPVKELVEAKKAVSSYEGEVNAERERHIEYEAMLRILASLGTSISVFGHEITGALIGTDAIIKDLKLANSESDSVSRISNAINRLKNIGSYITDLIDHSSSRDKEHIALHSVLATFIEQFTSYMNTQGILFDWGVSPDFLRTEPMHRSEIDSVLFNFLTNSVKSMDRANSAERKIKITAKRVDDFAVINFQDTGSGVKSGIESRIFEAFFTTSEYKGDEIAGPGTGLGLKIVHDIANSNGGYVRLVVPEAGYKCNFEFAVPISRKQL